LDRAIKKIFFESNATITNQYPIIVVANDHVRDGLIENNFSEFKMAFPEHQYFYCIDSIGQLEAHSLIKNPEDKIDIKVDFKNEVLAYPNPEKPIAYLINDNQSQVILKQPFFEFDDQKSNKNWETGLNLEANSISQVLYPAEAKKSWLKAIKESFLSKILTPHTSYIVVENEAQKAMILKKQQEVLSGNKALDLEDETQNMSEPDLLLIASFMLLFFIYRRIRL
jgi:hypothetical protein